MALFGKDYTEDFKQVRKDIKLVKDNVADKDDRILIVLNEISNKQDEFEKGLRLMSAEIDEIKTVLFNKESPIKDVILEVPDDVEPAELLYNFREVPSSNAKDYTNVLYRNFQFFSKNRPQKAICHISDVLKLKGYIDDFEDYPLNSDLLDYVMPGTSRNGFLRIVWNYQRGFFDNFIKNYVANTEFTSKHGKLCINNKETELSLNHANEIVQTLANASDFYECRDNLLHTYPKETQVAVKIVADHYSDGKLVNLLSKGYRSVEIENNPQKRREKAL